MENHKITCHKCGANCNRGAKKPCIKYKMCILCDAGFHTYDCAQRFEKGGIEKHLLHVCPKCAHLCVCTGGTIVCHREKIRRFKKEKKEGSLEDQLLVSVMPLNHGW